MAAERTFYITTPIYYPNDRLHIGHTYTTVAADALARYHRLRGHRTWFLTGTDEHGANIERRAREAGVQPLDYVNPIVDWIRDLWRTLHISYDDFIRTTEERHRRRVQEIFTRLYRQGDIYKGVYRGLYCVNCEAYYGEDELVDGACPIHQRPVEEVAEESYFFRLSRYQDRLLEHLERHPDFVRPETRRNEVVAFIRQGLKDLSVSRTSVRWGIPVPFDPKHVIYVWIDALANYITALDWPDGERFRAFWPADAHVVGKDILRFHAVIWPALLMALDLPLPRCVYAHGWLLIGGGKMGKSRAGGQVIEPLALVRKYGVDAVRYFLLREVPFGTDGEYSEEKLARRINADLANDLGNLVWRTLSMIERFAEGRIPTPDPARDDGRLQEAARAAFERVEAALERLELNAALAAAWDLLAVANKYIDEAAPWDLRRSGDRGRLDTVLYNLAETLRLVAVLVSPFLVESPARILAQLGRDDVPGFGSWDRARAWGQTRPGTPVRKAEPLFPRLDLEEVLGQASAPVGGNGPEGGASAGGQPARAGAEPPPPAARTDAAPAAAGPQAGTIDVADLARIDLRVAEVVAAEPVAGSDRLLKLRLRLDGGERTVVAGIARHYRPEELVGRRLVVVANLRPRAIRGVVSEGMVLAAEAGDHLALLTTDRPVTPGARVR